MTGVGGRPEIVLEGHPSDRNAPDGWRTYHFLYKPGNLSETPAVVAPHQPRLDWQMWFAALGNYQNNPWFLHLVYRLLQGEPDVLELLSPYNQPFPANGPPPKFVRATLYSYHYTRSQDCAGKQKCAWWKREKKAEYLPSLAINDKSFVDYLKQAKLISSGKTKPFRADNWLAKAVVWSRDTIGQPEGFHFTFSMFGSSILAMFLNRALF
ncbi:lipase maturation factor [Elysia marginata]|uniref:Lipase maturation factor 2 n=1 Tax=Elysia marginata TaxID=1093978 RepID=A0AAV4FTW8_9GAST|nr:lipase maturation factor [Elysia marginata]